MDTSIPALFETLSGVFSLIMGNLITIAIMYVLLWALSRTRHAYLAPQSHYWLICLIIHSDVSKNSMSKLIYYVVSYLLLVFFQKAIVCSGDFVYFNILFSTSALLQCGGVTITTSGKYHSITTIFGVIYIMLLVCFTWHWRHMCHYSSAQHFTESMIGSVTIRAFRSLDRFNQENNDKTDLTISVCRI